MRLAVRVTPKGGRDAAEGWGRDPAGRTFLKVRVAAMAAEGEANAALCAFIARSLGRPRSAVRVVSGHAARLKMLEIENVEPPALEAAFGPSGQSPSG
jgi:uncharacterized protein YggU (UPF0235/DUF167 family)